MYTTKFGRLTQVGRCVFLGVSHAPQQGGGTPALPNFEGFLLFIIYACTSVHPLTQNYQLKYTYGEGLVGLFFSGA